MCAAGVSMRVSGVSMRVSGVSMRLSGVSIRVSGVSMEMFEHGNVSWRCVKTGNKTPGSRQRCQENQKKVEEVGADFQSISSQADYFENQL